MIKIKQLLIAILLIFCLSIFYFCYNYYQEFRKFATANAMQEQTFESSFVTSQLQNELSNAEDHLIYMTLIKQHSQILDQLARTHVISDQSVELIRHNLDTVKAKAKIIKDIFFVDVDGKPISSSSDADYESIKKKSAISTLYKSIYNVVDRSTDHTLGNAAVIKDPTPDGKYKFSAAYGYPVLKESDRSILGYILMIIPFDQLVESVSSQYQNSKIMIDTKQNGDIDYYVTITDSIKFENVENPNKVVLYVSVLKRVDEIETIILDSILNQVETNIFISIFIGICLIFSFILIMHSFGVLFDFIIEIRNKSEVGKERFFVYEFNETSKQLLRMKQEIDSQLHKIHEVNKSLEKSNQEKEIANNQLANLNRHLEEQVQERTESLQNALNLSNKCNEINSTIISQRSLLKDDFTPKQVFDSFVSTIQQFNLKRNFLFEYKIENERKLKFNNIDKDLPELDDNVKIDTYLNKDGFYFFPLTIKEGVGRLIIHSPIESIETAILSNVSIFCRDVSIFLDNRVLRNRLSYWAKTDGLTKLGNRAAYENAIAFYETSLDNEIGLFLIDVNGLKEMNDKQGHEAGDALLKTVADRLKKVFSKYNAQIYRIGGDEFIVILQQEDLDKSDEIIEALIASQDKPVKNPTRGKVVATYAVGFADSRKVPFEMLYKKADAEMYARKEQYYKLREELFGEIRKPRH